MHEFPFIVGQDIVVGCEGGSSQISSDSVSCVVLDSEFTELVDEFVDHLCQEGTIRQGTGFLPETDLVGNLICVQSSGSRCV